LWTGLLEKLAEFSLRRELDDGRSRPAPGGAERRLCRVVDEMLANADRENNSPADRQLRAHGQEVLGRWADVMVSTGHRGVVDRHVELYSRLCWWGSVLDERTLEST
jgi:hypothetical protein